MSALSSVFAVSAMPSLSSVSCISNLSSVSTVSRTHIIDIDIQNTLDTADSG